MQLPSGAPTGASHVTFAVAAVIAVGGAAGYARRKSARSLAAGIVFSGALALAGVMINRGEAERGFRYAALTSGALAAAMGYRALKFRQVAPAGALAVLGAASTAYHGMKYYEFAD